MIKIIDTDFSLFDKFKDFCKINSFGTRIYSHYMCYGYTFDFIDFWVQIDEMANVTAVFCKFCGDMILSLHDNCDFEEVSSFVAFQDKLTLTFDEMYKDKIDAASAVCSCGDILMYRGNYATDPAYTISTASIKEYHNLLLTCESDNFFVPEYMEFLSDVSRRQQRQMCDICAIRVDDIPVSCAMTVSCTDFSVILGAVATHPEHRKHGYAGCVVKHLADKYSFLNSVYIYTTIERNTRFYESLGFGVSGRWIKYTYGG